MNVAHGTALLDVRDLRLERRGRVVLRDATLLAEGPGVVVVGGQNGAGKSTLLAAVVSLLPGAGGEVRIQGVSLATAAGRARARRSVGYLPQEPRFPGNHTAAEALAYAAWNRRVPRGEVAGVVEGALQTAGLTHLAGIRLRRLSGGERRRVHLAAASLGAPPVLVLDEPTVGIDARHRALVRAQVRTLGGRSLVLVASHHPEDFEHMADRVVVLSGGAITFDGPVRAFLDEGGGGADAALIALTGGRGALRGRRRPGQGRA